MVARPQPEETGESAAHCVTGNVALVVGSETVVGEDTHPADDEHEGDEDQSVLDAFGLEPLNVVSDPDPKPDQR